MLTAIFTSIAGNFRQITSLFGAFDEFLWKKLGVPPSLKCLVVAWGTMTPFSCDVRGWCPLASKMRANNPFGAKVRQDFILPSASAIRQDFIRIPQCLPNTATHYPAKAPHITEKFFGETLTLNTGEWLTTQRHRPKRASPPGPPH